MASLNQILQGWHEFYALLGAASATMTGLLFVAASVGSGIFSVDRRGPLRVFLSGSVVHLSGTLVASLLVLAPVETWTLFGMAILVCGGVGLGYSTMAWRDAVKDGFFARIDLEDRSWYIVMPCLAYVVEIASGVLLTMRLHLALTSLAASLGMLLLVAIHNAWDITIWSVARRRE